MTKAELHERISYVKSAIRIMGYVLVWPISKVVSVTLVVSELVGIAEEVWGA